MTLGESEAWAETLDTARDIAVNLEQQIAAVDRIHKPIRTCKHHGIQEHDCDGAVEGWLFRCFTCRTTRATPCPTWLCTHPLWAEGIG